MHYPDWTSPRTTLLAVGLGAVILFQAVQVAYAEPFVRGAKARVVTSPGGAGAAATGYYVPYVTGPGGTRVPVMQVPGSVTVVPRSLMDDQQATTLGEALRYVPGVMVGR